MRRAWLLLVPLAGACDAGGRSSEPAIGHLQGPPVSSSRRDPGTLVVGRPADAVSLDPARVGDTESVEVCQQIYEALLSYDSATRQIRPGLAESWKASPDGLVWTFRLRRGVTFHDGTPLDADAVVVSLERQRDAKHPFHRPDQSRRRFSYWQNLYRSVQRVEAVDEHTVRITIDQPYAPFEANMAMFPVSIVSPTALERWGVDYYRHPVGTGPFRFVRWEGEHIVLERNPDYWGSPPAIERLVFRSIPDARQRLIELESAAIDVAYSLLPDELQFVELHPDLAVYREPSSAIVFLALNTLRPPFDDLRVRRAVNHAINKESIVKLAYQGLATPATGPLPHRQWGHLAAGSTYEFDLARSRALLAEATADGRFDANRVLRLYAPTTPRPYLPDPEFIARAIQTSLGVVGIKTELVMQPMREHVRSAQRGDHDLCLYGWIGDSGDPDNFFSTLFDKQETQPGSARNLSFYRDDELQELLLAGQRTLLRPEREKIYQRAQERLAEQAPWVPLAHSFVAVAARRDVDGIALGPTAVIEFKGVRRRGR